MISHKKYMQHALKLAHKGQGTAGPHPVVGCVVVKRGKIVGRGFQKNSDRDVAVEQAIKSAGKKANNATLYTTIEPSSHWGKYPPSTELIVESGIKEVIIAMEDPHPLVEGNRELKFRGIKTKMGILRDEARKLNEAYVKYATTHKPFVYAPLAMDEKGSIVSHLNKSKGLSKEFKASVNMMRQEADAIMISASEATKMNSSLNRQQAKVIIDTSLSISEKSKVFSSSDRVIIATSLNAAKGKIAKLEKKGAIVIPLKPKAGTIDFNQLLKELGKQEIGSVVLEGNEDLTGKALANKVVDKLWINASMKLLDDGFSNFKKMPVKKSSKDIKLKKLSSTPLGKDVIIEGYL